MKKFALISVTVLISVRYHSSSTVTHTSTVPVPVPYACKKNGIKKLMSIDNDVIKSLDENRSSALTRSLFDREYETLLVDDVCVEYMFQYKRRTFNTP